MSVDQMIHKLIDVGSSQCSADKKSKPILRIHVYVHKNKLLTQTRWKRPNVINLSLRIQ